MGRRDYTRETDGQRLDLSGTRLMMVDMSKGHFERATDEQRRTLVELLVDRVVVEAPDGEIRYVIPLTDLARRNGALRPHHRERPSPHAPPRARPAALHVR